jgi:hypothetical protein
MYELKDAPEISAKILFKDKQPLFCPFKNSLLIPGQIAGQMNIHREPCGTHCALFTHDIDAKCIIQQCSNNKISYSQTLKIIP